MESKAELIDMAAEIVSAYVSANQVQPQDLPALIESVHATLFGLMLGADPAAAQELSPAVPIKKSITPEYIVCLEDGKRFKSLKRHLRTKYNMTPEEYRQKWNLPHDYPMVVPAYAKARSELAKRMGLGLARRGK